jgi:hypothetical protein
VITKYIAILGLGLAVGITTLLIPENVHAKRTTEEQAAKDSEKAAKKAGSVSQQSDRIRLLAKFRLDEIPSTDEAVEIEEGRELYVEFRNDRGRLRLKAEASNFEVGTEFEVMVGTTSLGILTVQQLADGTTQGELSLRDAQVTIPVKVGTIVQFIDPSGAIIAEGPMGLK